MTHIHTYRGDLVHTTFYSYRTELKKTKLSLSMPRRYTGVEEQLHPFLTSVPDYAVTNFMRQSLSTLGQELPVHTEQEAEWASELTQT
jgi:hypothetical protein